MQLYVLFVISSIAVFQVTCTFTEGNINQLTCLNNCTQQPDIWTVNNYTLSPAGCKSSDCTLQQKSCDFIVTVNVTPKQDVLAGQTQTYIKATHATSGFSEDQTTPVNEPFVANQPQYVTGTLSIPWYAPNGNYVFVVQLKHTNERRLSAELEPQN